MNRSVLYRLLLLGLLPAIGVLIYTKGQDYDPGLIRFQEGNDRFEKNAGQEAAMESLFPTNIGDFKRFPEIRTFTRDNLYEYVNGHAEFFITAGFERLVVAEYGPQGAEGKPAHAVVEIYDMAKGIQAFGVLSDESGGKTVLLETGATGFTSGREVRFMKDRYYIKIVAFNDTVPLAAFTKETDSRIHVDTEPFPEFARLPSLGQVVQTRYIREAYRGLDFLNQVVEREYLLDGKTLYVFLYAGDPNKINDIKASFMNYFRESKIEYDTINKMGKTVYIIKDPYEGDWVLIPLPDSLFGVLGQIDGKVINALVAKDKIP
jgi:hypothetical protein